MSAFALSTNRPFSIRPPGGAGVVGGDAGRLHRRAVRDQRVAVDALEHDRPVADHGVEIGGGREALVRPQFLVPAAADDPARVRMRGRISRQPLLEIGERAGADEVELKCGKTEPQHMPVRVDQAGQQCLAAAVDDRRPLRQCRRVGPSVRMTLPSSPISSPVKCWSLPVGADLNSIDIGDQRIGQRGRGEQQRGEREERLFHYGAHSIVRARGEGLGARSRCYQPPTIDDIRAAAERIKGAVIRTPMLVSRTLSRDHRRGSLAEVRESAVHRRLQGARRAQQIAAAHARGTGARSDRRIGGQPRAGGRLSCQAARHSGDDRHAGDRRRR